MALDEEKLKQLQHIAQKIRITIIETLHKVQTGHPGGSLSAVELLTDLYFNHMNVNSAEPGFKDRDRFVASKGHCAPVLYAVLAEKGFFAREELKNLRQLGSMLQGHPDMKKTPGVDMSTGSLGLGLSVGIGLALTAQMNRQPYYTYVLLGDGELQEGQIWEAAMAAAKFKLNNLIAVVDNNGVQLDGKVQDIMPVGNIGSKFEAFGWNVLPVDGHNLLAIDTAFAVAKRHKKGPTVIIANTVKGKGVSFMEGKNEWHGKAIGPVEYLEAVAELKEGQA